MSDPEALPAKPKRARRKPAPEAAAEGLREKAATPDPAPPTPKKPRKPRAAAAAPEPQAEPQAAEAAPPPAKARRKRPPAPKPALAAYRKASRKPLPELMEAAEAVTEEGLRKSRVKPPALRRYALQEAIEAFQRDVLALLTPKPVKDWRRKIAVRWRRERDQFRNKTFATQKLYNSRFRAPLRRALEAAGVPERILEVVFAVVRIEPEIMTAVNAEYQIAVDSSNRSLAQVSDWREIVAELTRLIASQDARFLAIGLMGLTGRRFVEVLKFGAFSPVHAYTPGGVRVTQKWLLDFSGQAKTRGAEGSMSGKTYPIPVLAPAADILEAFARLRAGGEGGRWAEMTPERLNSAVNPSFNKLLREHAPIAGRWPAQPGLTLKSLRAFYAEAAMEAFAPPMTKGPYFARILGHSETQYETALSYMTLSLNARSAQKGMSEIHRLLMERDEDRQAREAKAAEGESPGSAL